MKTENTTRPLAERITQGPAEIFDTYSATFSNETPGRVEDVWEIQCREAGNTPCYATNEDDAFFVVEAFNVTHETGRTPRQLADERAELIAALRAILNAPGEGYTTMSDPDSFETQCHKATELLTRLNS